MLNGVEDSWRFVECSPQYPLRVEVASAHAGSLLSLEFPQAFAMKRLHLWGEA